MTLLPRLALCLILAALPIAAAAQESRVDRVIAQLQAEGYEVTEVRRSWLGRIVITALDGTDLREVVLNRASGEILRDRVFSQRGGSAPAPGRPDRERPPRDGPEKDGPEKDGSGGGRP